jgi:hypothetical protein
MGGWNPNTVDFLGGLTDEERKKYLDNIFCDDPHRDAPFRVNFGFARPLFSLSDALCPPKAVARVNGKPVVNNRAVVNGRAVINDEK